MKGNKVVTFILIFCLASITYLEMEHFRTVNISATIFFAHMLPFQIVINRGFSVARKGKYQNDKKTQFFVCLLECVEETLKSCKMSNKFENSENSHDTNQTHDFSSFPQNLQVLQTFNQSRNKVWKNGQEINLKIKKCKDLLNVTSQIRIQPWWLRG